MSGLSTLEYSCIGTQSTSTSFTHGLWAEYKIPRHSRLKTQQTMWSIEQVKVSWILGASPRLPRKQSRCLPNEDSPNLAVRPQGSWKRRGSSSDGVFPRNPSKEQSSTPAWTFLQALDTRNLAGIQPCCGTKENHPGPWPWGCLAENWDVTKLYHPCDMKSSCRFHAPIPFCNWSIKCNLLLEHHLESSKSPNFSSRSFGMAPRFSITRRLFLDGHMVIGESCEIDLNGTCCIHLAL